MADASGLESVCAALEEGSPSLTSTVPHASPSLRKTRGLRGLFALFRKLGGLPIRSFLGEPLQSL
jgi:hypothetical protein